MLFSGGNAKTTERGYTNLTNFIKDGSGRAVVRVHICNRGERAFKRGMFGDQIVFERIIYHLNNRSEKILRSQNLEIVSQGKSASNIGTRVLEKMGIQLNNPAVILQQERAKVFFGPNWNPYDMYKIFCEATTAESTERKYKEFGRKINCIDDMIEQLDKDMQQAELELRRKKQIREEHKRDMKNMNVQIKRLLKRQKELDIEDKRKKRDKKQAEIEELDRGLEKLGRKKKEEELILKRKLSELNERRLAKVDAEQNAEKAKERVIAAGRDHNISEKDCEMKSLAVQRCKKQQEEAQQKLRLAKNRLIESKSQKHQKEEEVKHARLNELNEDLRKLERMKGDSEQKKKELGEESQRLIRERDRQETQLRRLKTDIQMLREEREEIKQSNAKSNPLFAFSEEHQR